MAKGLHQLLQPKFINLEEKVEAQISSLGLTAKAQTGGEEDLNGIQINQKGQSKV